MFNHLESPIIQGTPNEKRISLARRLFGLMSQNRSMIIPAMKLEFTRNIALYWRRNFRPSYGGFPANVGLNLTRRCNLKCKMCMQNRNIESPKSDAPWFDARQEMPLQHWLQLVDELATFRPWVSVTGGEPLLYPGFKELIQRIKEKRLAVDLTTNGLLLENVADLLVGLGIEIVYVSVDGPEEVHEEIRGLKGSFKRTMEGIRALLEARKSHKQYGPLTIMNCTMTKSNLHILDQMVPLAIEQGVDMLQFIHPFFNTKENAEKHNRIFSPEFTAKKELDVIHPSLPEGEFYESELIEEDVELIKTHISKAQTQAKGQIAVKMIPGLSNDVLHPYYLDLDYPFSQVCKALWVKCRVLPDGTVSPCLHVMAGNIKEKPLLELWNGSQMRTLRRMIAKNLFPACDRCCNKKF